MYICVCVTGGWETWRADRSNLHSTAPSHHSAIINRPSQISPTHTHTLTLPHTYTHTHNVTVTGRSLSLKHHHTASVITQEIVGEIEKVLAGVAHLHLSRSFSVSLSSPPPFCLSLTPRFPVRMWQKSVKGNDLKPIIGFRCTLHSFFSSL